MSALIIGILVLLSPLLIILIPLLIMFAPFMIPGILVIIVLFFPLLVILAIVGVIGYHTWKPFKLVLFVIVPIIIILGIVTSVLKIRPFAKIKEQQKKISADMKAQTKAKEDIIHKSVPKTWVSQSRKLTLKDDTSTTSTTPVPTSTVTTQPYLYDGLVSDIRPGDIVTQKKSDATTVTTAVVDKIGTGTEKNVFTLKGVKGDFNTIDNVIFTRKEIVSDAIGDLNKPTPLPENYEILPDGDFCGLNNNYVHLSEAECKRMNTKQLFSQSSRESYEGNNPVTEPAFQGTYLPNRDTEIQGCSIKKENGHVYFNKSDHKYYRFTQKTNAINDKFANICKIAETSLGPVTTKLSATNYLDKINCTGTDDNQKVTCENDFNNPTTTAAPKLLTLADFSTFLDVETSDLKTFDKKLQKTALNNKNIYDPIIINRLSVVIKNANTTAASTE